MSDSTGTSDSQAETMEATQAAEEEWARREETIDIGRGDHGLCPGSQPTTDSATNLTIIDKYTDNELFEMLRVGDQGYLSEFAELDEDAQYNHLTTFAIKLIDATEVKNQMGERLEELAKQFVRDKMFEDKEVWDIISGYAAEARKARDQKRQAISNIEAIWQNENVHRDFPQLQNLGTHTSKQLQQLSNVCKKKNVSYQHMKLYITNAQLTRLRNRGRGTSNQLDVVAKDFDNAKKYVDKSDTGDKMLSATQLALDLAQAGYAFNRLGFITSRDSTDAVTRQMAYPRENDEEGSGTFSAGSCAGFGDCESQHIDTIVGGKVAAHHDAELDDASIDVAADAADKRLVDGDSFVDTVERDPDDEENEDEEDGSVNNEHLPNIATDAKRKATDEHDASVKKRRIHACGCGTNVSFSYIKQLRPGITLKETAMSVLIRAWNRHKEYGICYRHDMYVLAALGMKNKGLNHVVVKKRLTKFHDAVLNSSLGKLKTGIDTYYWFRRGHRPIRPGDKLGPYKYLPIDIDKKQVTLTEHDQRSLAHDLGIDYYEWNRVGSINVDCFHWIKEEKFPSNIKGYEHLVGKTVYDVASAEFDMYLYHLREINRQPNYGWLRCMFQSLIQQVVRQDPKYYLMYVSLRKDKNHNLMSYPYYAKYQRRGDSTYFRHIDINIPEMVKSDRGRYQIQGTMSLDDEHEDDCTEIVPGMHRYFDDWAKSLIAREAKMGGFVHQTESNFFTKEDAIKYGTDWTAVPCKALQVRITQPHLPHGAMGPAKGVRRTIPPWFVGLQEDLHTLEIMEGGSAEELARAHRELDSGIRTPSGLENRYGDIPWPFPAALRLEGLGPIGDAILGRLKHDHPDVVDLKNKLFFDRGFREHYLAGWRKHATIRTIIVFERVKELEKRAFGEKSYWYRVENRITDPAPEYDPDPHEEYLYSGLILDSNEIC